MTLHVRPIQAIHCSALIRGVLFLCWTGIRNEGGIIAFSMLYGFFSGSLVSLPPVAITSLTTKQASLEHDRWCATQSTAPDSLVIPISGGILTAAGDYLGVQHFSGITIFPTGMLLLITRFSNVGVGVWQKV